MSPSETSPDDPTKDAERAEAGRAHTADRAATTDEERAAEDYASSLSEEERRSVAEHEREMDERGAHQKGEGRID